VIQDLTVIYFYLFLFIFIYLFLFIFIYLFLFIFIYLFYLFKNIIYDVHCKWVYYNFSYMLHVFIIILFFCF
jgi:hypothetical protein